MEDRCVCCGEVVPEGRMVCPMCEHKELVAQFTIYGNPATKKNAQQIVYVKGRPMVVPSKVYKNYEKQCKGQIPALGIDYLVSLRIKYYRKTHHIVDASNLYECTDDVLVKYGCLKDDNTRIVQDHDGSRVYFDKDNPRAEISIYKVPEPTDTSTNTTEPENTDK